MSLLIRIEGCDFASTILDTDDLSTIRGASLAYLWLPNQWPAALDALGKGPVRTVVVGASDGIYRLSQQNGVTAAEVEAALSDMLATPSLAERALSGLVPHLSFTWAVVEESDDYEKDLRRLFAACGVRQLQRLSLDVPAKPKVGNGAGREVLRPCPVDRRRPVGDKAYDMPGGPKYVSDSVRLRRDFGRRARWGFYAKEEAPLGERLDAAGSFADLVERAPKSLPPALKSKMAVVYFDGNKFTAIRETIIAGGGDGADPSFRHAEFAKFVRDARRKLLRSVIDHLKRSPNAIQSQEEEARLRFETLMWGGDEAMFVLPAWEIIALLPVLAEALEADCWKHPGGFTLSHAVGIAICNYKTPISVAKSLAETLANAAKTCAGESNDIRTRRNVFSWQIHESIEPPQGDLDVFRASLYGTANPEVFTLIGGEQIERMLAAVRRLKSEGDADGRDKGLPRSQLYGLIRAANRQGLFASDRSGEALIFLEDDKKEVAEVFRRVESAYRDDLKSATLGYSKAHPLVPLLRLAEIWDYVDPFEKAV